MEKIQGPALVTGAGGFIGKKLVARLLREDVSTRALLMPDEVPSADWKPLDTSAAL